MTGEELEVIVGHVMIRALLHRGLLSVLRYCYTLIRESYSCRQTSWRLVARELEIFRCLMPLCAADLRSWWDPDIFCADASRRTLSPDQVGEIGREAER